MDPIQERHDDDIRHRVFRVYYDHWGQESLRRRRSLWCRHILMKKLQRVWFHDIARRHEGDEEDAHLDEMDHMTCFFPHMKEHLIHYLDDIMMGEVMVGHWGGPLRVKEPAMIMMKYVAEGLCPSAVPFEEDETDRRVMSGHYGNPWAHEYVTCLGYVHAFCKLHGIPISYLQHSQGISNPMLDPTGYRSMLRRVNAIVAL